MTEHVKEAATTEWLDQPFDPLTADGWDRANCVRHGLLRHTLVHEAGHAVAAARLNIEFVDVFVLPPGTKSEMGNGFLGGALQLVHFENGWAVDRIDDAYEMYLMGAMAERNILQHQLKDGFLQDLDRFKRAGNNLNGLPEAEFQPLHLRVKSKIDENWLQIERDVRALIRAFAAQFTASGEQVMSGLSEPLLLTSAEVHSILNIEKLSS
ncbi:hypothetical protein [Arthrobacter sp. FW306-2-2C-D06B]|uniref:hypothetical protein n=1 Tax=Arthrobacter sp. FW306-2-2C-D06B TaxID=2879618 RepID=UPI001F27367C|nr:hypothetical protein [Arthrobacter sp. FW306-2-2C-D06B]UKA56950.1 hypothetical protein LFT47_11520 [Arthrobacter sp. FW306-2-2C-D06B]